MRTLTTSARPTNRLLRACAILGVALRRSAPGELRAPVRRGQAIDLHATLRPGQIALITGPSGGGKTTLLRSLAELLREHDQPFEHIGPSTPLPRRGATVLDSVPGDLPLALGSLARAGLADAIILAMRPRELSDGQRARLRLAVAIARLDGAEPEHGGGSRADARAMGQAAGCAGRCCRDAGRTRQLARADGDPACRAAAGVARGAEEKRPHIVPLSPCPSVPLSLPPSRPLAHARGSSHHDAHTHRFDR
jgi:hypothetical protein